jgi:hypothetical protein
MATARATRAAPRQFNLSNAKELQVASNTHGLASQKEINAEFERRRYVPQIWVPINSNTFGFAYWYPNKPLPNVIEVDRFKLNVPAVAQGKKNILLGYKNISPRDNFGIYTALGVSILSESFPTIFDSWRHLDQNGLPIGKPASDWEKDAYLLSRSDVTISALVRGDVVINRDGGREAHMEYAPTSTFPVALLVQPNRTFYPTGPAKYQNKRLLRSKTAT